MSKEREAFEEWSKKGCDDDAEAFAGTDLPESVSFAMLGFYGGSHFGYSKAKEEVKELEAKIAAQKAILEDVGVLLNEPPLLFGDDYTALRNEIVAKIIAGATSAALSALGEAGEKES